VIELEFDAAQCYLLHRPGASLDAARLDLARIAFPPDPRLAAVTESDAAPA
jgi:hypothetical protein